MQKKIILKARKLNWFQGFFYIFINNFFIVIRLVEEKFNILINIKRKG
jgi:hypothetical protein